MAHRVHIGLTPIDDEPDEKPDRLGRELLKIVHDPEMHGKWFAIIDHHQRGYVTQAEGRLSGRVSNRIAGVKDIRGWEARVVDFVEEDGSKRYQLRVRYSPPKQEPLPMTGQVPLGSLAATRQPLPDSVIVGEQEPMKPKEQK